MTQLTSVAPRRYPLTTVAAPAYTPDKVARAFINEGKRRNIATVGIQEAICCGLDESGLRVLANPNDPASEALPNDGDGYDHDSDGPLQQRGASGWGTVQCRMDPTCSVGLFYDQLVKLDYANLSAHPAGWWIQQVQRSYDSTGSNYQAQWPSAVAIYNRLASPTGIPQANIDLAISIFAARINDAYVYGGAFSPTIVTQGTDCSGMCDTILQALTHGTAMQWGRHVSTESWPYDYGNDLAAPVGTVGPYGTLCAGDAQPGGTYPPRIPSDAAAIVYLMHGGGGESSHMMINVNDGHGNWIVMETGGAHDDTGGNGKYASRNGPATSTTSPEWTDIWYLPGPVGVGGLDMDANQDTMLRDLHGALFNPIESQSPFRLPNEGAIWRQHQMPVNIDGMTHPQYVEWAARKGDSREVTRLQTVAAMTDANRAADAALAMQVLANLQSGGPPVVPNVIPPAPQPIPVPPVPDTPVTQTPITLAQLLSWGRDAVTIIGTIGTWATAIHGLLGQFLPGASAVAVPSAFAAATVASGAHQVHQKRVMAKALARAPRSAS
jgi:hypothetical protein